MLYRLSVLSIVTLLTCFALPSNAETCKPLNLVGGEGSEVSKTVSQPTIPGPFGINVTSNNWNTDWSVPGGQKFQSFKIKIVSESGGSFGISMYLKYSDQTSDQFFDQESIRLEPNTPLIIEATPRKNDQPFQINLFVGGLNHLGNSYRASALGCL
jgi:hypothetical protein